MKAKRFLSVILCIILMLTLLPMTTQAALFKLPESTPGGLTITWYSAMRFYGSTTSGDTNISSKFSDLVKTGDSIFDYDSGQIDEAKSIKAYNDRDRSVCLGSETFSVDSYKADKWVLADNLTSTSDARYVWGEVSGYIKMPVSDNLSDETNRKAGLDIHFQTYYNEGVGKWGTLESWGNSTVAGGKEGEMVPFTLYIGKMRIEPNEKIGAFSLDIYTIYHKERIPANNFYSQLSLKDMQRYFVFNPDDYTLTLDPMHKTFPVKDYEYGIVAGDVNDYSVDTATGFQPLQLGVNSVTPDSGTLVIRNKILKTWYISLGTANLAKPRNVAIIQRTPTTCTLSWKASLQIVPDDYKIKYDIYRREAGHNPKFVSTSTMAISNEFAQVSSTTDLTFTDKGLKYDSNYEYCVKAAYPTGFSPPSDIVNTDSVAMEQIPSAPTDLKAVPVNQTTSQVDLKLSWSAPPPRKAYRGKGNSLDVPIKEYIIYQKITRRTWGVYFLDPQEIARTTDTSYIDRGFGLSDQCVYYVQSVESTGNRSYSSSPLEVSIQNLIASAPKIEPNTLMINNGDTVGLVVQYDDSYTGERSGTWSVADSTIVSVEESNTEPITINPKHTIPGTIGAKVTGKKPGTTTVTFTNTATGISDDCNVTVIPAFKIAPDPLTVYTDETGSLAVTFDAGYKGSRFGSWSVDDNTVASIDQNGVVTGKKAGTAIVTYESGLAPATSAGGNGSGVKIDTASRVKSAYDIVKTASVVVKPGSFTVNFDPSGGSPKPESVTVRHDTTVDRPADPSMSDRQFLGWFTAPQGGLMEFGTVNLLANDKMVKKWDFTNDKVKEDMTLYAWWGLSPAPSGGSSIHIQLPSWPYITGPDTINLTEGYESFYQSYTFGGYPAPTYGISDTEPNTAGATFSGNTLTIPGGLGAGSYVVTLYATNSEGTRTKTITVNVSSAETLPTITGPDTINLLTVSDSVYQAYTFGGYPLPTYGISDTEPNTANATFAGTTLTIPEGLDIGSYEVTLFASNSAGTVTKTVTVNVIPAETPPTITGPDAILLPPPYTSYDYPYTVTGSPTTYGITNISSSPGFFSFDGVNLSIASGLDCNDSPFTLTLTVTNSAGTATKDVTVYVIMMEPTSFGVDEGDTKSEELSVTGAGLYTLSLQNAPTWVSLLGNTLTVSPPAGTLTGGSPEDFTADIVIMVSGGETYTTPIYITVNP